MQRTMPTTARVVVAVLEVVMVVMVGGMMVGVEAQMPKVWKKGWDTSCCQPQQNKTGDSIPSLPKSFSLRVEANLLSRKMTTTLHEFYNYDANIAAVKQVKKEGEIYFFYMYNTNTFLNLFPIGHGDNFCFKQNLTSNPNQDMFGLKTVNSSMDRMYSVLGALHFGGNISEKYLGKENVRGIPCNKWRSCQYVKALDATSNVFWYFSDKNQWSSISGYSVPIRCHVLGIRWINESYSYNFDHIYEFYDFQADVSGMDTHFEVPTNSFCQMEGNTKPLPTLPPAYSFSFEMVDLITKTIGFGREEYDSKTKLLRYDYRDAPQPNSPFGTRYMSEYHDFNTGVAYVIDVLRANCTVTAIGQYSFDDVTLTNGDVRLRNPKEFLDLNHNYVYQGVRNTRGIDCDTWAAQRFDYPDATINNPPTIWTWYFATTKWMQTMGFRQNMVMPVMLEIFGDGNQQQIHTQVSYYEYNTDEPDLLSWDISSCFSPSQSRNYAFLVQGRFRDVVAGDLKTFKYYVVMSLQVALQVSPIRIAKLDVQEAGPNTLVLLDLLDKAPLKGDVNQILKEPTLTAAFNKLDYMVRNDQMRVLIAKPGFANFNKVKVLPAGPEYQIQPRNTSTNSKFTAGSMGGMAVGMLVLGALVGFIIMFAIYRSRGGTFGARDVPMRKFGNEGDN